MDYLSLLLPNAKKLLVLLILFVLATLPGIIPAVTDPMMCVRTSCNLFIGLPVYYVVVTVSQGSPTNINFNFFNLAIDIIIFYLIISILFYLFRRRENVPNSNSKGRSVGGPDQVEYGNQESH